ncbi:Bifunctional folate synthesis protein [compost metagenome]
MGRVRKEVWGPRVIDIDMIAYERVEMATPRLTLPHPHAHERDFVLAPLGEIAPEVTAWLTSRRETR